MDFSTRSGVRSKPSRLGSSPMRRRSSRYISSVLTSFRTSFSMNALDFDLLTTIGCAIARSFSCLLSGPAEERILLPRNGCLSAVFKKVVLGLFHAHMLQFRGRERCFEKFVNRLAQVLRGR